MNFDTILEIGNTALAVSVIQEATKNMILEQGSGMKKDVEDYIKLINDKDYSPTDEFEKHIAENLRPYLDVTSKFYSLFLTEAVGTNKIELDNNTFIEGITRGLEESENGKIEGIGKISAI